MCATAQAAAPEGVHIEPMTAPFGTLYIANRAEAAIAAHAVLDVLARVRDEFDGAIISAFGDPGLAAARELFAKPVVGIAESALLTSWMLGRRISIVCMTQRLRTWYQECAHEHGLGARVVAVRALDTPVHRIERAKQELREPLLELCRRTVIEDDAEVIIIGGGPLAGLGGELAPQVPVPVVDGVVAATELICALVRQAFRAPTRGSFARPQAKPSQGLSEALAARIEHR